MCSTCLVEYSIKKSSNQQNLTLIIYCSPITIHLPVISQSALLLAVIYLVLLIVNSTNIVIFNLVKDIATPIIDYCISKIIKMEFLYTSKLKLYAKNAQLHLFVWQVEIVQIILNNIST